MPSIEGKLRQFTSAFYLRYHLQNSPKAIAATPCGRGLSRFSKTAIRYRSLAFSLSTLRAIISSVVVIVISFAATGALGDGGASVILHALIGIASHDIAEGLVTAQIGLAWKRRQFTIALLGSWLFCFQRGAEFGDFSKH